MAVELLQQINAVRLAAFVRNPEDYKSSELYVLRSDKERTKGTLVLPLEITYGQGTGNALQKLLAGVFSVEEKRITRKASPPQSEVGCDLPGIPIEDYLLLDGEKTIGWLINMDVVGAVSSIIPDLMHSAPLGSEVYYTVLLPEKPEIMQIGRRNGEFLKIDGLGSVSKSPEVEYVVEQYIRRMNRFMAE